MEAQARPHKAACLPPARVLSCPEELEGTGSNASGLLAQRLARLPAPGEAHPVQPVAHAAPQLDLTAPSTDGLRLQVKQDHAGTRTIGDTDQLRRPVALDDATRLHQQSHSMAGLI